jgi:UDP-N-acetylglucosamine 2-epimerase (non-hydrolysing)
MAEATCVLTDSREAQTEATALGVPCFTIGRIPGDVLTTTIGSNVDVGTNLGLATRAVWSCLFSGGKAGSLPELWDGRSGARIANYLAVWLPASQGSEAQSVAD